MATWKKLAVSGSNISQFNNDAGYLTSASDLNAFATASYDGTELLADSSNGNLNFTSGSGGEAGLLITATAGTDTLDFSLGTGAVPNAALVNSTISGISLGSNLNDLTVDNSTLKLDSGTTYNGGTAKTISVKDAGITNTQLANFSVQIGTTDLSLGATGSSFAGVTLTGAIGSGSFSGSFEGDGSGLTGVQADTLANALTAGTGVDFDSGTTFDGSAARTLNLDLTEVIATDGNNRVLTSDGDGTLTAEANFTFDGSTLTVTGNEIVTGNLTVQGTASFQNTTELQVADRFILMASGSATPGDGGIVVQQDTQNIGEVFAFDSATTRWGLTGSFDASNTAYTPDAFMAAVSTLASTNPNTTGPDSRYDAVGNIYVSSGDESIWIYS